MPATPVRRTVSSQIPKIDAEFQRLIAPITPEERRQLESNLVAEGCRDALVVWKGYLLDGHNRFEICSRIGIQFRTCEVELPSRDAAKLWIEENQLGRRNLTQDQRAAIAFRILQRRVAQSKKNRARKGGLAGGAGRAQLSLVVAPSTKQTPRLRERLAAAHAVSPKTIRAITHLANHDPAIVERLVAGTLTIKEANQRVREEVRSVQLRVAMKSHPRGSGIHTGDLSILKDLVPDNSADLFLTDPPYDKRSNLALFGKLAQLAQAKLKPGGFCLVYCGSFFLPEVLRMMMEHLDYYWLCGIKLMGPHPRIWSKNITQGFKPVLMFVKRPAPKKAKHAWMADMLLGGGADKDHHKWGQASNEFEYWIDRLTLPGSLVVDPFCGGGAVPEACVAMHRQYVATELDPAVAAAARARVVKFQKTRSTG